MSEYKDLIEQSIAGDAKSQQALYEMLKGRLMGICLRYSNSQEDSYDIFQEAAIRIFKNIHRVSDIKSFNGWIRKIAVNTAIDAHKKSGSEVMVKLDDIEHSDFTSHQVDAIEHLQAQEIIELLQLLPSNQRVVFNLFMIEGYAHKEIAELLDIAESTSRVLLTRAKKKMVELLNMKGR